MWLKGTWLHALFDLFSCLSADGLWCLGYIFLFSDVTENEGAAAWLHVQYVSDVLNFSHTINL